jgi:hypothetical protein
VTHQVVTVVDEDGISRIALSRDVPPTVEFGPGFAVKDLWRIDETPKDAGAGYLPESYSFEPTTGCVFRAVVIPPDQLVHESIGRGDKWGANSPYRSQGEDFGMHRTETLDFVTVVSGSITLCLSSGEEEHLETGDVVVQRGTRHAWRNAGPDEAVLHVVMFGLGG